MIIQAGADALADDPLSSLELSNRALWAAIDRLKPIAPRLLVLGGGGYNPWSVARAWTGIWAGLNGLGTPERLPPPAEAILRDLRWNRRRDATRPERWFTTLADAPREGPVRATIDDLIGRARTMARTRQSWAA
jgi:acetoin utilization protein AcuC